VLPYLPGACRFPGSEAGAVPGRSQTGHAGDRPVIGSCRIQRGISPGSQRVRCLALSGLTAIPGIPGSRALTATASSPLDIYRARALGFSNSEGPSGANPSTWGA